MRESTVLAETTDDLARRLLARDDCNGLVAVRERDLSRLCHAVLESANCPRCRGLGSIWCVVRGMVPCRACDGSGRRP